VCFCNTLDEDEIKNLYGKTYKMGGFGLEKKKKLVIKIIYLQKDVQRLMWNLVFLDSHFHLLHHLRIFSGISIFIFTAVGATRD
jgi:hypothetical protein